MDQEKAEKIIRIYNWVRFIIFLLFVMLLFAGLANAQSASVFTSQSIERRIATLEAQLQEHEEQESCTPQIHGILRGKYEYQPEMNAGRFEVRNARLSASGKMPLSSEYKLEVDLCDESAIKMKDAWVRIIPWKSLRFTIGQQRMPFSIDAHRSPSAQYFANRSFIAKQVGDMRDVGFQVGYDIISEEGRKILSVDGGIFNGSNLDNQKSAWFKSPGYSTRIQYFPVSEVAIVPSIQHQQIAERKASYTSVDLGSYYESRGWHIEVEYLHKFYAKDAFEDCRALDAMILYKQPINKQRSFIESISYIGRFDWMQDHSSGKNGFVNDASNIPTSTLAMTDAERQRMTLGTILRLRNPRFPTDIRLNYEKYWYPHDGAKQSEQDKLVCELMIKF